MGDFSGDALREVSLPLVEKPVYSAPVTLSCSNRLQADSRTKVPLWVSVGRAAPPMGAMCGQVLLSSGSR